MVLLQPLTRLVEDPGLNVAHQHNVKHGIVRYEDIGRMILHIPPGPHFTTIHGGEEACSRGPCDKLRLEGDFL
jgi:hypothetical protein